MNTPQLDQQYIASTYGRFPLTLVKGKGSLLWDENGKEYIDLGTGIAVNGFGVADDEWLAAVTAQLGTLTHCSNLYYSEPSARLAQLLCERTGMKKVFFSNSGAEANECAIKTARKYAADRYGSERSVIVTLVNSFHGRTLATLAATGQDSFHQDFLPLTPGFSYINAGDLAAFETLAATGTVAGILMECVQGEGGVMPLEKAFVQGIAEICAQQDILLMVDEVQTGNGRCGALYCYMNYGIHPDIVSTAKGLCGGLPLGATLFGEKTEGVLTPGTHGSTFGGNPVCCAGALSVISRIDDALLQEVRAKSDYIFSELASAPGVRTVSGMGLMIGISTERPAGEVISDCMEHGVLVIKAKEKVRLLPALNIPWDALKQAIAVLKQCCAAQ